MKLKLFLSAVALFSLGACSTLPSSGPTGGQIRQSAEEAEETGLNIDIVSVDSISAIPAQVVPVALQLPDREPPPSDMIGPGDLLSITIFEAGVSLFAGQGRSSASEGAFDPSVRAQELPPRRVDDDGMIQIPYVGEIFVLGDTIADVQEKIRNGLRGLSQDPQVSVTLEEVVGNSVIIGGEVATPGRLVLQTNRESFADAIALSGGYRGEAKDLVLLVERGENLARLRLSDVLAGTYNGLRAYPGDRLTIVAEPMTFSVLGASGRVQQFPFTQDRMSVVEAIAMAGGPSAGTGNPKAIFLFRYLGEEGKQPTVYHFNMMQTPTFFLAQQFALRDDDVLYFGNSASNQPLRLIQTIGQLFTPIVTATAVANNLDN
ncbi:polysaccharide biosynthesis/export family protein [Erythrobacter rubeus]|uniref:Polysaccharide export protein n=1 Tax=Erythrobacter rubeus TaxID=2760803 RepID=A0ABR8KS79_9SPHN|nr:polysaccharide biosynthesis/export family protein [Erythrobacter rubeus]MBD2841046.1 polysaccharide export protein [Erythrobacter rubeus]